jgi:hypothetical protein
MVYGSAQHFALARKIDPTGDHQTSGARSLVLVLSRAANHTDVFANSLNFAGRAAERRESPCRLRSGVVRRGG